MLKGFALSDQSMPSPDCGLREPEKYLLLWQAILAVVKDKKAKE